MNLYQKLHIITLITIGVMFSVSIPFILSKISYPEAFFAFGVAWVIYTGIYVGEVSFIFPVSFVFPVSALFITGITEVIRHSCERRGIKLEDVSLFFENGVIFLFKFTIGIALCALVLYIMRLPLKGVKNEK